jgi:hypothetical protein
VPTRTHKSAKSPPIKEFLPPLFIGTLGAIGVVVLFFTLPGLRPIELMLLLLVVLCVALGFKQRILRGVMTLVFLYFASGLAATLYKVSSPYIGAPFGGEPTFSNKTLAFIVLMLLIWIALEALGRAMFGDTTLPMLGILDNLGGTLVYLVVGILIATLLFNAIGYGWVRAEHNRARLRPEFRQVFRIHYFTQSFWFSGKPPHIYSYDLEPPSEP